MAAATLSMLPNTWHHKVQCIQIGSQKVSSLNFIDVCI